MGYRSEVALALVTDAAILLKELCEHNTELKEFFDNADESRGWEPEEVLGGCTTKFLWSHVKWYEGYNEIDMVETFMNNISEDDYYFLRIGDDSDDNESRGCFWESDMYISRSIAF